jgi:hypothetical protein
MRSQRDLVKASLDMETGTNRHEAWAKREPVRSVYVAEAERFLLAALAPTIHHPR